MERWALRQQGCWTLYDLVVFDIASREVIMHKMVAGEARGFGLRNYWAGSIYDIIKANKKLMR